MELNKVIEKIESFKTLNYKGWNGYDSEPISEKVISKALELVKQLKPVPKAFPTGRNSIQFEWEKDELYLEMEIFEDSIKIFNMSEYRGETTTIGDE